MPNQKSKEPLKPREQRALVFIRNRIVHGLKAPTVRELADYLGFSSPRSAAVIIDRLIKKGFLRRKKADKTLQILRMPPKQIEAEATTKIPLVGSAPCGSPMLAVENIEAYFPVSLKLAKPPHEYFLLRAVGNSMNEAGIADGSLVLVRQQDTANNQDIVVAVVDEEATIKKIRKSETAAALIPISDDPRHKPIILNRDFHIQGIVVATISDWTE